MRVYVVVCVNVIGDEIAQTSAAFVVVQQPVIVTHLFFLIVPASLCFLSVLYSTLFTSHLISQIRARKRARLKAIVGQFNRDDWIGKVPGLLPGKSMYECLFETAPFAHHEIERKKEAV